MRIIGPPSASQTTVEAKLVDLKVAPVFLTSIVPALWDSALYYTVDPVGVVAQSFKETGGGKFSGRVKPWFYNTAGIKVRHLTDVMASLGTADVDHPLCHQQFSSWPVGAEAHVQHLRAYTGWPVGAEGAYAEIVDPRYVYALRGPGDWCENFEDLGGKWAPSPTYGTELVTIARRLQGR